MATVESGLTAGLLLERLGVDCARVGEGDLVVRTPITGEEIGRVAPDERRDADATIARAVTAFESWRDVPGPRRGELVRLLGEELRREKETLGALVTLEVGKIAQEGLGEVQEMIDICDFAVGLSRQLYGRSIASERPGHRLAETWHPLGPVAVITAFNFPVAVWSWNAALALVCGDPVIWKPSERTPLTAIATLALFRRAAERFGDVPDGLAELVVGGADRALQLADDPRLPLVSATGSTQMGKAIAPRIASRLGRSLLELGGNNAAVVAPSADLDLVVRGVLFAAVGTAGQRCTSLRRLIVQESIADELVARLRAAYRSITLGDPRETGTLVGPLVTGEAFGRMEAALGRAVADGGEVVVGGGRALADRWPDAWYAEPTIVRMPAQTDVVREETFGPVPLRADVSGARRRDRAPERRSAGARLVDLHDGPPRGRALPRGVGIRLWDRQRQHRPQRRRDRRRIRRARRTPVVGASRARTPGRRTCAVRPRPSTSPATSRWRRGSSSTSPPPPDGRRGRTRPDARLVRSSCETATRGCAKVRG